MFHRLLISFQTSTDLLSLPQQPVTFRNSIIAIILPPVESRHLRSRTVAVLALLQQAEVCILAKNLLRPSMKSSLMLLVMNFKALTMSVLLMQPEDLMPGGGTMQTSSLFLVTRRSVYSSQDNIS